MKFPIEAWTPLLLIVDMFPPLMTVQMLPPLMKVKMLPQLPKIKMLPPLLKVKMLPQLLTANCRLQLHTGITVKITISWFWYSIRINNGTKACAVDIHNFKLSNIHWHQDLVKPPFRVLLNSEPSTIFYYTICDNVCLKFWSPRWAIYLVI